MTRLPELLHAIYQAPWPDWFHGERLVLADWLNDADDPREEMVREKMPLYSPNVSGVLTCRLTEADDECVIDDGMEYKKWLLNLFPEVPLTYVVLDDYDILWLLNLHESREATSWRRYRLYGFEISPEWMRQYVERNCYRNVWPQVCRLVRTPEGGTLLAPLIWGTPPAITPAIPQVIIS